MSDQSKRLLDYWSPPSSAGRSVGCLATTFTFDAEFFEQQCLARFLGLDARGGDNAELAFLIEREERLAETPVVVLADRGCNPDGRSLRWDIVPVGIRTGVVHAKLVMLAWEHSTRFLVSSANLVENSYRRSIELAIAVDVFDGCDVPRPFAEDLVAAARRLVELAPTLADRGGPAERAGAIVDRVAELHRDWSLPERWRRADPQLTVVATGAGRLDALAQLRQVWGGGRPLHATVMSPFFDAGAGASRAGQHLVETLARRNASTSIVVPVQQMPDRDVARVPCALLSAFPPRIPCALYDVRQPDANELRSLHGKLLLLTDARQSCGLIGSANFTAPGLGLGGGGNVELGIAVLAKSGTPAARALGELALQGAPIGEHVDYEAEQDPEERTPAIPIGFRQAIFDAAEQLLSLELDADQLPDDWSMTLPSGELLLDDEVWRETGAPNRSDHHLETVAFNVVVRWLDGAGDRHAVALPINVLDPAALPPPEELRALPLDVILRALASTRPLHESIVEAVERHGRNVGQAGDEADPLRRFSATGQLLHRTREVSAALAGLQDRLERPAMTLDAIRWRVEGPFGPLTLAGKLVEARSLGRSLCGETSFLLGEVALTLAAVDLGRTTRYCPQHRSAATALLRGTVRELACLRTIEGHETLVQYVNDAFARAGA